MYDIDPTRRPTAVKEAIRILVEATEPLRPPRRTKQAPPRRPVATPPPKPPPARVPPRPPQPVVEGPPEREEQIKRRMSVGMTREMAEAHVDSGSRIGPDGEDLDDPLWEVSIPTVDIEDLRGPIGQD
jgi:hypothetical protein